MTLLYMLSDTELAESTSAYNVGRHLQPDNNESTSSNETASKNNRLLLRLLLLILISAVAYLCLNWRQTKQLKIPQTFNIDRRMVTGILHCTDNSSALVRGQVAYEGDTVKDCKVIKIYRDKVLIEKDGKPIVGRVSN